MSKLKRFVAGNWKMNGDVESNKQLLEELLSTTRESMSELAVFPPSIYIGQVSEILRGSHITYGAQNIATEAKGAYTGEVSGYMLKDMGCKYVLVGHSERRTYYGEIDEILIKKIKMAQQNDLIVIFCIGESDDEYAKGKTKEVIEGQVEVVIQALGIEVFKHMIIAYEPLWAIGTGKSATSQEANAVHEFIRCTLAKYDDSIASLVRIVYGGSVNAANVRDLFHENEINGALVGGASLKADEFTKITLA